MLSKRDELVNELLELHKRKYCASFQKKWKLFNDLRKQIKSKERDLEEFDRNYERNKGNV